MAEILKLIEGYGLPLVLLLGALYALYNFFFFSIREVKKTFEKKHEKNAENMEEWHAVTRRETLEGAEKAIDGSIDHYSKKLDAIKGPKVVKTFE